MLAPTFFSVGATAGCTLADLSVTGYDPLVEIIAGVYTGGCAGGDFILRKMKIDGSYDINYFWIDNGNIAPGWYADSEGTEITGGASSVKISAGEGVWGDGSGYDLVVPGAKIK